MDIRQLSTFIEVARVKSFTKAGEKLGYTQSTVTNHIRSIEEAVGNKVFDRLGKTVRLTDSGERLLKYAKKIIQLHDEAIQMSQLSEMPSGTIRVGANESLMAYRLPAVLLKYKKQYPTVKVLLQPSENQSLQSELKEGKFDCALFINPERLNDDIVTVDLIEEQLVLVGPRQHRLTQMDAVPVEELENEVLLLTEKGSYRELLEEILNEARVQTQKISFWNIEAIKQSVKSGLGLSFLPKMTVIEELERGDLVHIPLTTGSFNVFTQLAYHEDKWITPALASFIDLVKEEAEVWKK